jgi:hypothetical protein
MTQNGKLTAAKLQACVPYTCSRGNFLQLPFTSDFSIGFDNTAGVAFLSVPGQELNAPPKYDFLVHAISALVDLPFTYMRVQWPDGKYFSNVPVDIWSMMQTGRNGRLLEVPKFIEKNGVIRMEFGTQQTSQIVNAQVFFEGCILIPA